MKKLFACAATPLAALGILLPASPPAQAYRAVYAQTNIEWGGTPCIVVASAALRNQFTLVVGPICSASGTWSFTETATSGMFIGADPDMGDADWLSCQIYVNGILADSNFAHAGDGNEVNCIRTVNF